MAKLIWDKIGSRFFETGVDRGVLYPADSNGVAWSGLTSVSETPSGGEATPYYMDGVKYLNVSGVEEFGGTIEAYTYPDEFAECDGSLEFNGFSVHQQRRKSFGFSYRTRVGNDLDGSEHGYKIHIVYNALAAPTQNTFDSVSDNVEAMTFAWKFTTSPITKKVLSVNTPLSTSGETQEVMFADKSRVVPFSHITIDSRKSSPMQMVVIESFLYGTKTKPAKLLTLEQLFTIYENPQSALKILESRKTGLSPIVESELEDGDFLGSEKSGLYTVADSTRLSKTTNPGLYVLE